MKDRFYFPSTSSGKTWQVYFYKPQRGPAYISACEGEYTPADTAGGFASFSFMLFQNRTVKQMISGPATAKKKVAAFDALVAKMKAEGLIKEVA